MSQTVPGQPAPVRHLPAAAAVAWRAAPHAVLLRLALAGVASVVPLAAAWLTKTVVDALARPAGTATSMVPPAVGLAVCGILLALLPRVMQYTDAELGRRVALLARDRLFGAVERLTGLGRLEDPGFHDRLQLAADAGPSGPSQVLGGLLTVVQGLLVTAGFVATLSAISPWALLIMVVATVPTLLAELRLSRARSRLAFDLGQPIRREFFFANLLTSLTVAKEVRLLGLGPLFRSRMTAELSGINAHNRAMDRRELRSHTTVALVGALAGGAGTVWAILAARSGNLTIGDFTLFVAAVAGVQGGLGSVIGGLGAGHGALMLFGHYREVVEAEPDLAVAPVVRPVPPLGDGIVFEDVWFRYGEEQPWVLKGLRLTLPAGRSTGLVGLNGAGKSTVVKLLCRFYDPVRGRILWDGVDLRDLPVDGLRARLAAVFQDFTCYELSAAENIGLGDVAAIADRPRIQRAAASAGVHDALDRLPRGYDTLLTRIFTSESDRDDPATGVVLSGGQWQRVALARALMRGDRDLLILDEPSSGLDAEAEHAIHERLQRLRAGRASLLITHRLNALRGADLVAVLADGVVAEQGSHAELMAHDGHYAHLFRLQAQGFADGEPADMIGTST
ncbi:ABC transporter ATP-binding protein [Hamadaea sp. NPDC051192]|uniref:ABC transporter ATP-binding protein n=1 Tax=Hamadaea sp. NPDC051192 TaxID=3154940 RepID=UPI00343B21D5